MKLPEAASGLLLVRHAEIAARYQGLCYGSSDVELSPVGIERSRQIALELSQRPITRIVHSGLARTRFLAEQLGELVNLTPICCEGFRERHFGDWELRPWQAIFEEHGSTMDRILTDPVSYRPGGGETTYEMRDRIASAFQSLPPEGLTVVVTHGGPIAVWRGIRENRPVHEWPGLIPAYGEISVL